MADGNQQKYLLPSFASSSFMLSDRLSALEIELNFAVFKGEYACLQGLNPEASKLANENGKQPAS